MFLKKLKLLLTVFLYKVWVDKSNKRIRFLRISVIYSVMCVTIFIPMLVTLIGIFKRPKHKRQHPINSCNKNKSFC